MALMGISENIATLNVERFAALGQGHAIKKPAVLLFEGDAYRSLSVRSLDEAAQGYLRDHLCLLSGLYGVVGAFDAISPYRLEMGTALENKHGTNLYAFWGDCLAKSINARLKEHRAKILVNLASKEYSKAIDKKALAYPVIDVEFKVDKGDGPKVIGILAKKARGAMVRFAATHGVESPEELKSFAEMGYAFENSLSDETHFVFVSRQV